MASENLPGEIPAETRRWMEIKVYRRRVHHNKTPAPVPVPEPESEPEPIAIDLNSAPPPPPPLPPPVTSSPPLPHTSDGDDKNESANADLKPNRVVKIKLRHRSKSELCGLRRILTAELDQVRAMSQRIDKFLGTDTATMERANSQHSIENLESNHGEEWNPNPNAYEVDQNTNEDDLMVIDKQMIPPITENKTDFYRNPFVERNYDRAFCSCKALLTKLTRHKFGWVFNEPVDVEGLGLHDYHHFIREPMDLGTVKSRLAISHYSTPLEFAGDIRLTFRNAMTYNPKGHDVHLMAEQLLQIFESGWPSIEAEYLHAPIPMEEKREPKREPKPKPKPKPAYHSAAHRKKHRALEKPKAKDLHKRDMTIEEKQKLRDNLEKLPQEKLEGLVDIIRKRSTGLNQKDDELEVDIDCMDTETLWDLDRYVTNYKKSLSKYRRKAELAALAKAEAKRRSELERVSEPVVGEQTVTDRTVAAARLDYEAPKVENRMENPSGSICSRSSSSDSGSSSSDSDSDSSSSNGSIVAHSSKT